MSGQAVDAAQEMAEVSDQGAGAQVQIGDHDKLELLKQGAPTTVIGEDTGVQHLGGGGDEMGHGTPDGAAFGDRSIAVVGGSGQLVLGCELVIPL